MILNLTNKIDYQVSFERPWCPRHLLTFSDGATPIVSTIRTIPACPPTAIYEHACMLGLNSHCKGGYVE